jgi:hypothetical protein
MIVYKLNEQGQTVWQYPAEVLERGPNFVRLEAFFNRDDTDFGFATFKRGDRFVEYFYSDRWYNIFAVYDRDDGALKGWYCNICRPAVIGETAVHCEDLALDLWVTPSGQTTLLDVEEFNTLDLPPTEQRAAWTAVETLQNLARSGLPI